MVERLNGIEEVRGSNPLGSTTCYQEFTKIVRTLCSDRCPKTTSPFMVRQFDERDEEPGVIPSIVEEFVGHDLREINRVYTHIEYSSLEKAAESLPDLG